MNSGMEYLKIKTECVKTRECKFCPHIEECKAYKKESLYKVKYKAAQDLFIITYKKLGITVKLEDMKRYGNTYSYTVRSEPIPRHTFVFEVTFFDNNIEYEIYELKERGTC